ncbi:hypothetical protein [Arthrobacter sp. 92]|jgi:hypothetical protein|uniref:hypothetical protein n=1 Tax=Arthrobacter sp. 92 TaxID=3418175 RepID=UPI003D00C8BC
MNTTADLTITVTASDPVSIKNQLDDAVTLAMARAMRDGSHGILITQNGYGSFTVTLSDAVPFGVTLERRDW